MPTTEQGLPFLGHTTILDAGQAAQLGHSQGTAYVMSLNYHPKKEECICSCDENEIPFWTVMSVGCTKAFRVVLSWLFQSGSGKHLAGVVGKSVVLVDLENPRGRKHALKGHGTNVQFICWDASGEHLVSVLSWCLKD